MFFRLRASIWIHMKTKTGKDNYVGNYKHNIIVVCFSSFNWLKSTSIYTYRKEKECSVLLYILMWYNIFGNKSTMEAGANKAILSYTGQEMATWISSTMWKVTEIVNKNGNIVNTINTFFSLLHFFKRLFYFW